MKKAQIMKHLSEIYNILNMTPEQYAEHEKEVFGKSSEADASFAAKVGETRALVRWLMEDMGK